MNTLDKFKYAYQKYFCNDKKSRLDIENRYSLMYSGVNNYFFNYMFIHNDIQESNPFLNIDFDTAIFSFNNSTKVMEYWSSKSNLKFLGRGAIMTKTFHDDSYIKKEITDISVVQVKNNKKYLEDYFKVMSSVKNINEKEIKENFTIKINDNENIYVYLAYLNNEPVGTLSAIVIDDYAISVDSAIIENSRSVGVLTALGEKAMTDGINKGIKSYSSIVTSPYTMKLVERQGYKFETICDVWVYINE